MKRLRRIEGDCDREKWRGGFMREDLDIDHHVGCCRGSHLAGKTRHLASMGEPRASPDEFASATLIVHFILSMTNGLQLWQTSRNDGRRNRRRLMTRIAWMTLTQKLLSIIPFDLLVANPIFMIVQLTFKTCCLRNCPECQILLAVFPQVTFAVVSSM